MNRRRSRPRGRRSRRRKRRSTSSRADLANAQWNLDQTAVYAPANGYAINVQLRPGSFVTRVSGGAGDELRRGDLPGHRALRAERAAAVEPGNEAEIALKTYPGRVIKATVDSIVWAQGQGQVAQSGTVPQTGAFPQVPGRFAVKLDVGDEGSGPVPRRRRRGRRRDLHRARRCDPHHAQGDPARRVDHQLPHPETALMRSVLLAEGPAVSHRGCHGGLRAQTAADHRGTAAAGVGWRLRRPWRRPPRADLGDSRC